MTADTNRTIDLGNRGTVIVFPFSDQEYALIRISKIANNGSVIAASVKLTYDEIDLLIDLLKEAQHG